MQPSRLLGGLGLALGLAITRDDGRALVVGLLVNLEPYKHPFHPCPGTELEGFINRLTSRQKS
jgi:hypothetical protein